MKEKELLKVIDEMNALLYDAYVESRNYWTPEYLYKFCKKRREIYLRLSEIQLYITMKMRPGI